ncbi:MAG TPA: hypothetical protein VN380_01480 [Thermoanaerobaculia bacterium]|jgi:hypothetical protein|nr:hypothetical protein [Thermoanaerobaculia bacterium]
MTTTSDDAQQKTEAYLGRLRRRLRGLRDEHAGEIVEELRGHIAEKAAAGGGTAEAVSAALAALGSPEELASQYMTYELMARAEVSRSPLRILESLFRWASLSIAGFFVLMGTIAGYGVGGAFLLSAALKPFHPRTAGLWSLPSSNDCMDISLRLGFGSAPAGSHDLLGLWIVPVGIVVGCGLVTLTTRFAIWCAKQYRRTHGLERRS